MPLATELSLRLALDRMARLGATASDIAQQLSLPLSTVRGLRRRSQQAGPDCTAAALQPRYHGCGPRPIAAPPLLESTLELRRQHPRWGAGRIRVELKRMTFQAELPSVRTIQRRRAGMTWLRPHPVGRKAGVGNGPSTRTTCGRSMPPTRNAWPMAG